VEGEDGAYFLWGVGVEHVQIDDLDNIDDLIADFIELEGDNF